jgi:hypothetical protein
MRLTVPSMTAPTSRSARTPPPTELRRPPGRSSPAHRRIASVPSARLGRQYDRAEDRGGDEPGGHSDDTHRPRRRPAGTVGTVGTVDGDNRPPTGAGVSCSRSGVAQRIGVGEGGGARDAPVASGLGRSGRCPAVPTCARLCLSARPPASAVRGVRMRPWDKRLVGSPPTPAFHPSTEREVQGGDESDESIGSSNSSGQEEERGENDNGDSRPHEPKERRIGHSAPHPPIGRWRVRFGVWSLPPSELDADGEERPGSESDDGG